MAGVCLVSFGAAAQPLDRIRAVVAGHVILASDVRGFLELGLIEVDAPAGDDPARTERALTGLIGRRLALDEVDRYRVAAPAPERIEREVAALRRRVGGEAALADRLATVGLARQDLRQILQDNARLEAYVVERFGTANQLSESELRVYFDANRDRFADAGRDRELEAVRGMVRARLWEERRAALVDEWMAGLVRRGEVTRFGP